MKAGRSADVVVSTLRPDVREESRETVAPMDAVAVARSPQSNRSAALRSAAIVSMGVRNHAATASPWSAEWWLSRAGADG